MAIEERGKHPVGQPVRFTSAQSDQQLINLWLHDKASHSERAYRADVARFLTYVGKRLGEVTLEDVHAFSDTLSAPGNGGKPVMTPAGRRALAAVKSLMSFGQRVGYLQFNVGAAVQVKRDSQGRLAERILSESEVHRILAIETSLRNRVLLRFLYHTGIRVSELCALKWRDMLSNDDGSGTVIVSGKRGKERNVQVSPSMWADVLLLRGEAVPDSPVFLSARGGSLTASQVWRIVRSAATAAGIGGNVSPHWLRHSHASHAIDRGAPIPLVRDTLGHASIATTNIYVHARSGESSGRYLAL